MDDLVAFAQRHSLKIGTIRDLIAYRRRHDRLVERKAEVRFASRWGGEWRALSFYNRATGSEQLALVKGEISADRPTLVRMHALSPLADMFGEISNRYGLLARSMKIIGQEGAGVVVVISRPSADWASRVVAAKRGETTPADVEHLRDYGVGAQILAELGVHDMILLTNSHHTLVALGGYGLNIVAERRIDEEN
jgi:3,4-dihydroxy 2-butanone 4-phosphate synthase/GTP cyclohydrolase II